MATRSPRRRRDPHLTLQWHVTNRCNWRCKHCYHTTYAGDELPLDKMKRVFDEYIAILRQQGAKARLNITGGEPFVRDDFIDFLSHMSSYADDISRFGVLTNGSLLTSELLTELKTRVPALTGMQISIEGDEQTNDEIRGKGSFQKILAAAALAKEHGFSMHLAATISKMNYKTIFDLLDLLLVYDIPLVMRRFAPIGMGGDLSDVMLTPAELKAVYERVAELEQQHQLSDGLPAFRMNTCTSGIKHAIWPGERFASCGVPNRRMITLMPNGDVYPCRLLPEKIGNVTEQSLAEIYDTGYVAYQDRQKKQDEACQSCPVFSRCAGGAPCISKAVTGDFFAKDPQCSR